MKLEELTGLTAEQKIKALIIYDTYGYEKADTNSIDLKSTKELEDLYNELKGSGFRVKDEEHSKQIQEYLFSLRYHWDDQARGVDYTDAAFLFTNRRGYISQTYNSGYGENHEHPEYRLKETKSYSLEEVKPIKTIATLGIDLNVEVIVNGEKISLKELKELLNKE